MTPAEFKAIREALGLTQTELGQHLKTGITRKQVSRLEKSQAPIRDEFAEIMRELDPR